MALSAANIAGTEFDASAIILILGTKISVRVKPIAIKTAKINSVKTIIDPRWFLFLNFVIGYIINYKLHLNISCSNGCLDIYFLIRLALVGNSGYDCYSGLYCIVNVGAAQYAKIHFFEN